MQFYAHTELAYELQNRPARLHKHNNIVVSGSNHAPLFSQSLPGLHVHSLVNASTSHLPPNTIFGQQAQWK